MFSASLEASSEDAASEEGAAVVSAAACYHFGSAWNAVWGTGLYRIRPVDHGVFLDAAYGYIKVRLSEGL